MAALTTVALVVCALALGACATSPSTPASQASTVASTEPLTIVESPPEWRPGDRWVYEWVAGPDRGTKAVDVMEIKTLAEVRYYVLRFPDGIEHYYTRDLHWAAILNNARVAARMLPPHPWFNWPLTVGASWTHEGRYEDSSGARTVSDRFTVVAAERVEVPAGAFQTLKIVRETTRQESDQYWYAPDVGWYVRWVGRRNDVEFEERLQSFQRAPRLVPAPPAK